MRLLGFATVLLVGMTALARYTVELICVFGVDKDSGYCLPITILITGLYAFCFTELVARYYKARNSD